mgnify:FL=1
MINRRVVVQRMTLTAVGTFRAEVIGATNPAAADPRSIRGSLYADRARTGLAVTYRENIIHASASPFEALIEKNLWIPEFPLGRDPLWQALKPAGLTLEQMHAWRDENPQVRFDGAAGPLVEALEDRDTDWVADRLLTLIRLGARPGATETRPQ